MKNHFLGFTSPSPASLHNIQLLNNNPAFKALLGYSGNSGTSSSLRRRRTAEIHNFPPKIQIENIIETQSRNRHRERFQHQ